MLHTRVEGKTVELSFSEFLEMCSEKEISGVSVYNDETDSTRYYYLIDRPGYLRGKSDLVKVVEESSWEPYWISRYSHHMARRWDPHGATTTQNSCGTCDGAACEGCELLWEVEICRH